jgi:cholesterol transport system auxiliary component
MTVRLAGIAALASLSAACVSVLPEPPAPPRIYSLSASTAAVAARSSPANGAIVAVELPAGPRALMGSEIAWRTDGVLAYVAGAEWAGRAPELLQALLADTLDRSGLVQAGVRAGSGIRADYEIVWDLSAFYVDEERGVITARVSAAARLVDVRTRGLIAQVWVDETQVVDERSQTAATLALQQAARDAADRIARELGGAAGAAPG